MKPVDLKQLEQVIRPVVEGQGYDLVEVEWKHEAGAQVLRIFLDHPPATERPVGLDDCAAVSRELSAVLDVSEVLPQVNYNLEVSSPGLNRPLKREADFRRFVGRKARIRTRRALEDNRRNFSGLLVAVEAGPPVTVRIDVGDRTFEVPVEDVEKANLVYEL